MACHVPHYVAPHKNKFISFFFQLRKDGAAVVAAFRPPVPQPLVNTASLAGTLGERVHICVAERMATSTAFLPDGSQAAIYLGWRSHIVPRLAMFSQLWKVDSALIVVAVESGNGCVESRD